MLSGLTVHVSRSGVLVRRPRLGRGGGDQRAPPGPASGRSGVSPSRDLRDAEGGAVVLQREVDDADRLQAAGREVRAALRHARRRGCRVPVPEVEQLVGDVGRQRATSSRASAFADSMRADRSSRSPRRRRQLTAGRRVRRPGDRGRRSAVRHQAESRLGHDHRLTGLDRVAVERSRTAETPRDRPRPGTPRRCPTHPPHAAGPARRRGSRCGRCGQTRHRVRRVVAQDGVDHEVGDDVAAEPGGAPPGESDGSRQHCGHGG